MIVVTGASGNLGQLVIQELLKTTNAKDIVAVVRDPKKVLNLSELGINVRKADYEDSASLKIAFKDAKKILLISSSEIGKRFAQHKAVIDAAKELSLDHFVYTSILKADTSPLALAEEHIATEKLIKEVNLPYTILRNGWYLENYESAITAAPQHGAVIGSAKNGKVAAASRLDYAAAAAVVLTTNGHANKTYELAGDEAFSLDDLADEISKISGKKIVYKDLPESDYTQALVGLGLPEVFAQVLANSDVGLSKGGLYSESRDLSSLIKRKTTNVDVIIKQTLGK